jgi:2'-5' RNA ligase
VRLFVSVPLPAAQREHLRHALVGGRSTNPDQWHLTRAFLGDRDDELALLDALAEVAPRHRPFELRVAGSGRFPGVEWAGVAGQLGALEGLAADVAQACRVQLGVYRPHITIARRGRAALPVGYVGPTWTVSSFDLVHSALGSAAEHHVLQCFPLA